MAANFICKASVIGVMLSTLYIIDKALGSGFALGIIHFFCTCKCEMLSNIFKVLPVPVQELLDLQNGVGAVTIFVVEIIGFAIVMMLVNQVRDRSEQKIDDFLKESKIRLQETYSSIEKWKNQKNRMSYKSWPREQSASGDGIALADLSTSSVKQSLHAFFPMRVDSSDVIRLVGDDEDSEMSERQRNVDEDEVVINEYFLE